MAPREYGRAQRIAKLVSGFLIGFVVFCLGFFSAHLGSVEQVTRYIASGEGLAEMLPYANDPIDKQVTVWSDVPNALEGGAVMIGPEFGADPAVFLFNSEGHVLHRWNIQPGLYNPALKDWWKTLDTDVTAIDDAHLLPGGDLIFTQILMTQNNYRGQRLARMDRNSKILWQVPGNFHHLFDIAGNPATIYTLSSRLRQGYAEIAPVQDKVYFLEDFVEAYSLDGKKRGEWSIMDAFARSPYRTWLSSFEIDVPDIERIRMDDGRALYDLLHPNSVQYLDAAKAAALPFAKAGDLLISLRSLSALAVLRPETGQIVWAVKGPWRHQHTALVGEDNKLYFFDNEGEQAVTLYSHKGAYPEEIHSRVVRYNPFNYQFDEIYGSHELHTFFLGQFQPLPDGSWIIGSPERGRILKISPQKKIVWEMRTIPDRERMQIPHAKQFSFMRYYPASELGFLTPPSK